jgi:K+:H+ antiporter subunit KhtT
MTEVTELRLPGVGIRYEFSTRAGDRVEVVAHRSGRRDIFVGDPDDPDSFRAVLELTEDESQTLAELLGGSRITRELTKLRQALEGLAIDWLPVDPDSPYVGRTIGDTRARTRTGVSIVAVMRGEEAFPAPGPEFGLQAGDTLVVVGLPRDIETVVEILHAG